jgi:hypothetical protein
MRKRTKNSESAANFTFYLNLILPYPEFNMRVGLTLGEKIKKYKKPSF